MNITYHTTPNQLYKEASNANNNNEARYRDEYVGQEVQVTGRVRYISARGFGLRNAGRLAGAGGVWWGGEVQGNLDPAALKQLNPGDIVTVAGRLGEVYDGYRIVTLDECSLIPATK